MGYTEEVEKLLRQGAQFLGEKNYEAAVEAFGEACSANEEKTSEIDPDLFLLYGKALFESGVSKSDVLGGQEITNEKIDEAGPSAVDENEEGGNYQFNSLAAEGEEEEEDEEQEPEQEQEEDEDQGEEQGGEEEEEEDDKSDLEMAWDILEVARNLFEDRLEANKDSKADLKTPYLKSDKDELENVYVKTLKQLSEVYDLLGEVSLESEHFPQAASDLEKCLEIRQQLYDGEYSSLVGESHFKLSLALEFCLEDDTAKDRARDHIDAAIKVLNNDSKVNPAKKAENDDIIQSLQVRRDEIEGNAEDAINQQKQDMLEGILGSSKGSEIIGNMLSGVASGSNSGGSAKSSVNDLSGMVKKRKAKPADKSDKRTKK